MVKSGQLVVLVRMMVDEESFVWNVIFKVEIFVSNIIRKKLAPPRPHCKVVFRMSYVLLCAYYVLGSTQSKDIL